jgi:hypothetical protein
MGSPGLRLRRLCLVLEVGCVGLDWDKIVTTSRKSGVIRE